MVGIQIRNLRGGDGFLGLIGLRNLGLRLVLGLVGLGALAGHAGLGRVPFHVVVLATGIVVVGKVGPLVVVLLGTVPLHLESVPGTAGLQDRPLPLCAHH